MDKYRENALCLRVTFISGVILILFGTTLLLGHDLMFSLILDRELALAPHSSSYEVWRETPVPMHIDFYFFNWTNPKELGKEKPAFVEMGPFRFRERHKKVNITWNKNGTVSFRRVRTWYFDDKNSNGTLEDRVTTLNAVALTAAVAVRDWNFIMKKSLSMGLSKTSQQMEITKTVNELLFEGYSDSLLDIARKMQGFGGVSVPFDKFGWFYTRNGSDQFDGYFNMDTGSQNLNRLGKLSRWNYDNQTSYYYDDHCSKVVGSAGEFWPPNQQRMTPLTMFSPDLCRSIAFQYLEDTSLHGIEGYKYAMDKSVIDNGTEYPENECYCNGQCSPSGVINVTTCRYGAPAFVSYPHFFLGDQYYLDAVDGMKPDGKKHRFYITIEPQTGIPLDVAARLQINLLLQPIKHVALYNDAPLIYFPMLWFNQRAAMTPDMAASLKLLLKVPFIATCTGLVMLAMGSAFLALSLAIKVSRSNDQYKKNITVVHLDKKDRSYEMPVRQPLISKSCDVNLVPQTIAETT